MDNHKEGVLKNLFKIIRMRIEDIVSVHGILGAVRRKPPVGLQESLSPVGNANSSGALAPPRSCLKSRERLQDI
jgi:hypothetical protein